ncbi:MAG TPA: dihydroneopterin aldolase [Candidatus Eremiobacteraceae bacterium]|nr:dihydroneopterin aldolase [Candidatus Eremiobacteraceae bacterium]
MPAIIRIRDMRFWGRHGANPGERDRAQPIDVDVELRFDAARAVAGDDLAQTIDYDAAFKACERVVSERSFTLLESIAGACLDALFEDARVQSATVRVRKPRLLDGATPEVELTRIR